jgi:GT2 family glycosyltransferase
MSNPLLSVIVLNWNGKRFLDECLSSLRAQTYKDFEVILVDNGSNDGSVEFIKDKYGELVTLIENERNLGFATGNNQGIRAAKGDYILLLNNDTRVDPRWMEELVKVAEKDRTIGMCASKILCYDDPRVIDNVGHLLYRDGLNRGRGRLEKDVGQYEEIEEVLFPSGCAALYRREMLEEIGLFDDDFFAYGDDTDLGLRGRWAGWRCLYVPQAVVYHKYSGSTGSYSPFKAFYVERNRLWIALKFFPRGLLGKTPYYTLKRFILQAYGAIFHRGAAGKFTEEFSAGELLVVLIKAYLSALGGMAKIWRKRKEIRKFKRVSNKEIISWFDKYGISAREIALKE